MAPWAYQQIECVNKIEYITAVPEPKDKPFYKEWEPSDIVGVAVLLLLSIFILWVLGFTMLVFMKENNLI